MKRDKDYKYNSIEDIVKDCGVENYKSWRAGFRFGIITVIVLVFLIAIHLIIKGKNMNLQTIKEQGEKEFDKFWLPVHMNAGETWKDYIDGLEKRIKDWHNSQIDLAYKAGKEDAFLIGYKKGEEIQMPWDLLYDEEKERILKSLNL